MSLSTIPRVGHMAYAFGFLSLAIHSIALIIIVSITTRRHIRQKQTEAFSNLDDVRSRVCMAATNNPEIPFLFTSADIPALRSIPGSPNECYFLRRPADVEDVDCTRPTNWNIPQSASNMVKLSSKIVNGSSRCVLNIKQGEPFERYASLQEQMVQRDKGVGDLEFNIAQEKEMTTKLEKELMLAKDKLQQLKAAPLPVTDVCQSKNKIEDIKKNDAYRKGVNAHLSEKLDLAVYVFENESPETLASLLENACTSSSKISRCDALNVSTILQKQAKEWTTSDRQAVLTSLRIVGGAAPGSAASNDDLRVLLTNICTSTSTDRCSRLHPVYSKILKDRSYTQWTQEDRSGVLMLIWAHTGLGLQHLGNDVLALYAERLCSSSSSEITRSSNCYRMGGEMMPPSTKPTNTWGPPETHATKSLISAITGKMPDNQLPTEELKKRLDGLCSM